MSAKRSLIASLVLLVLVATVDAGGWAVRTVRDLPDYVVAGKPFQITFMVRQHGVDPLAGVEPALEARSGAEMVKAMAVATKKTGEYTATLLLPRPGTWTVEISAYGSSALPPLTAIAPGQPAPPLLSPAALGERLFVAKGCISCHVNRDVDAENILEAGPDLTGRRFPETYLKSLLTNPKRAFARDAGPEGWEMPNLELKEREVAALVAFLNRPGRRGRP